MYQSSERIGAIVAALAKAQAELTNPANLGGDDPLALSREEHRTFRYASLASGLDIVRKALSQQDRLQSYGLLGLNQVLRRII